MPFLIPLAIGAVGGGSLVWGTSALSKKLTTLAVVGGIAYMLYKRG